MPGRGRVRVGALRALGLVVLVLLAGPPPGPASAVDTANQDCGGVLVVVSPPEGRTAADCVDPGDDASAADAFEAAGHRLTRVQRFPGAVCRVDGVPADAPCVAMPPPDAYWGFFDTVDGSWHYATRGVDAVRPGPGTAVALVWQRSVDADEPALAPGGPAAAADEDVPGPPTADTDTDTGADTGAGAVPVWVSLGLLVALLLVAVVAARRRGR